MAQQRAVHVAIRMAVDAALALVALAAALGIRFYVALHEGKEDAVVLLNEYTGYFRVYGAMLALTTVCSGWTFGIYTRARFYAWRQKLIRLVQANTVAFLACVFFVYLSTLTDGRLPRAAFFIAFVIQLALLIALRWARATANTHLVAETPPQQEDSKNVLVVGGAGYIGSAMVRDLLADGYRVRVLDSLMYGDAAIRELYARPNFEFIKGDFRHVGDVVQAVKGMDAVIHLGAIVGDPACAVNEEETVQTNLTATRLLAEVCRASNVRRLLFASTCSVYGAAGDMVDENSWLNPVSLYAATKIDSEKVLLGAHSKDFHPVILRLATAFGWSYRPRFDLVVNLLTAKAVADNKIVIYNGEQWRPFIHVRDIARAFRAALRAPVELISGQTFNVGSNRLNLTLQDLAQQIAATQPDLEIEYVKNSDARTYRVSFDKIRTQLGFDCDISLAEGVAEMQKAIERGEVKDYRDAMYSNVQLVKMRNDPSAARPGGGVKTEELTAPRFLRNASSVNLAL